jgi:hypothetical protein
MVALAFRSELWGGRSHSGGMLNVRTEVEGNPMDSRPVRDILEDENLCLCFALDTCSHIAFVSS